MIVSEARAQAREKLATVFDSATIDTDVLLCHSLNQNRAWLIAHDQDKLTAKQAADFEACVQRRMAGDPVSYITGEREFWSLKLSITADVLDPRPDTEILVEHALALIPKNSEWHVADLGTGSGAIALAIASERPQSHVLATDISTAALNIAGQNAEKLRLSNLEFAQGSWFDAFKNQNKKFQCIVSNPPYIDPTDPALTHLKSEPQQALISTNHGMADLQHIVAHAAGHLTAPGHLLLEHGASQAAAVRLLMKESDFRNIQTFQDFAGLDRVTAGQITASNLEKT